MSRLNKLALWITLATLALWIGCTSSGQSAVTPTPAPPCSFNYPGEWHKLVSSQVRPVTDGDLFDEILTVVEELHPDPYPRARGVEIYMLQHPNDPETIFVECDQLHWSHGHVETVLLRRVGGEWTQLGDSRGPWSIWDRTLFGFAWECNGWSLYIGLRDTEYQHGNTQLRTTSILQSRDNGETWGLCSRLGTGHAELPMPPIPPPPDTILATGCYDEERQMLSRFAWTENRTLYALTYPITSTLSLTPNQ